MLSVLGEGACNVLGVDGLEGQRLSIGRARFVGGTSASGAGRFPRALRDGTGVLGAQSEHCSDAPQSTGGVVPTASMGVALSAGWIIACSCSSIVPLIRSCSTSTLPVAPIRNAREMTCCSTDASQHWSARKMLVTADKSNPCEPSRVSSSTKQSACRSCHRVAGPILALHLPHCCTWPHCHGCPAAARTSTHWPTCQRIPGV
mmetsp:Transcript_30504/g.80927  ORF Transcript_30504/g.80927 Transcript_30504/m.80927 type:complete len:203 (-) Transcript_30504:860-1468(-)